MQFSAILLFPLENVICATGNMYVSSLFWLIPKLVQSEVVLGLSHSAVMGHLELHFKQAKRNPLFLPGQSTFLCFLLVHLLHKFNFSYWFFFLQRKNIFCWSSIYVNSCDIRRNMASENRLGNFVMSVS